MIPKSQSPKRRTSSHSPKVDKSRSTASRSSRSKNSCPHCVGGAETYGYLKRSFVYDVDKAREIVSDGRQPVEVDPEDVSYLVDNSRIYDEHIDHVDTRFPGIIAHLWGPGADGSTQHGHLLIDGNHRAARCLRDGIPFFAHVLSMTESRRILVRGPERNRRSRKSQA